MSGKHDGLVEGLKKIDSERLRVAHAAYRLDPDRITGSQLAVALMQNSDALIEFISLVEEDFV